jgi:hypothetical protein
MEFGISHHRNSDDKAEEMGSNWNNRLGLDGKRTATIVNIVCVENKWKQFYNDP